MVDSVALPMAAYSDEASAETVDALWGADSGLQAWATGSEQNYVAVAIRLVKLAPSTEGLLVTQRYGFEVLKRQHVLLVREGDKLNRAWSADDPEGPAWSKTALLPEAGGSQAIAYWNGFLPGSKAEADQISVEKLTWDRAARSVASAPLPDASTPLLLTVAGEYGSIAQARAARAVKGDCLAGFFVLSTAGYAVLPTGKTVVAAVEVARSAAESLAGAAEGCGAKSRIFNIAAGVAGGKE